MSRDHQKSKVYAAGDVVRDQARQFNSLAEIQKYVDEVTGHEEWTGTKSIQVKMARRDSWKSYCTCKGHGGIAISPAAGANDFIVLHELAHAMCWTEESHGAEFCEAWLTLVRRHRGVHGELILRRAFEKHGVVYSKDPVG